MANILSNKVEAGHPARDLILEMLADGELKNQIECVACGHVVCAKELKDARNLWRCVDDKTNTENKNFEGIG